MKIYKQHNWQQQQNMKKAYLLFWTTFVEFSVKPVIESES